MWPSYENSDNMFVSRLSLDNSYIYLCKNQSENLQIID
jgi:hypothetical protein